MCLLMFHFLFLLSHISTIKNYKILLVKHLKIKDKIEPIWDKLSFRARLVKITFVLNLNKRGFILCTYLHTFIKMVVSVLSMQWFDRPLSSLVNRQKLLEKFTILSFSSVSFLFSDKILHLNLSFVSFQSLNKTFN